MNARVRSPLGIIIGLPMMFIAGMFFLSFGWNIRADLERQMAAMIPAQGVVVEVVSRTVNTNSGNRTFSYPVVEYRTATGELIRFESTLGGNPPAFQTGDRVEVLYDPQTPQSALVNTWEHWLPVYIFLGAGGVMIGLGSLMALDLGLKLLKLGGLLGLIGAILWRRRQQG
ncbi:DUF3592 domain-containing protein [Chloroflexus islandicus]|nr:DUF3592 domain-containing protein [Chloroflexus islandicus]